MAKTIPEKRSSITTKEKTKPSVKLKPEKESVADKQVVKEAQIPNIDEPVTFGRFRNSYRTLAWMLGVLTFLILVNFTLLFVVAYAVGGQLDQDRSNSLGGRVVAVEEKANAIIEALPSQFQPKLNITVLKPDKTVDRWKGDKENRYVLIEYSDLECPYCQSAHPEVVNFQDENTDSLSLVFRNLPLTSIHANAQTLAQTAECVADINGESAFWSFVDGVYAETIPLTVDGEEQLRNYVENSSEVAGCVTMSAVNGVDSKIQRDINDAISATVSGTPTFILYDMQKEQSKFVANPGSKEGLQQIYDQFRAKQEK